MGNRYTQPHHTSSTSAENAKQFIPHPSMPHHAPAGFLTWISQIFHTSSGPQARYVGAPPPHSAPQPRVFIPKAYFVPLNAFQSLDLVSVPQTPEMEVKHALLSEHPEKKVISLTGAVGTGKTNILCALGRDQDIMNAFSDGVWFFHLRCDVNHSTEEGFQFFLNQMNLFVAKISRDLSADFQDIPETTRLAQTPSTCIDKLMPSLMTKKVVLLFDDLSRDNEIVYDMVRHMASAVLFNPNSSLKILVSTRNSEFAQVQPNISSVQINPQVYTAERNRRILCSSAGLPNCDITSLSDPSRKALNQIVEKCGGLALALRIAGYGVGRMMGRSVEVSMENAFVQYWEKLEIDSSVLWRGPSVDGHEGLSKGIESGLGSLQKTWTREEISVEEMFTSFCVVQKKEEYVPLGVIMKLWNVNKAIALEGMEMFEENGVAILVRENRGIVGIKIADLMRELSVDMARRRESGMWWHTRIIDGYRASTNRRRSGGGSVDDRANESRNERSRWVNLDKNDKYIIDNIVWHLLGAGHENEVLRLVTEYTWIEKMNQDEQRPAFEKIGSEFEMLREHLKRQGKTETDRRVKVEIEAVLETIGACAEYRYENRKECTFQLYGRLCCVEPASSLVKRIIWSIERDAECPWARAGPGVQMNEASSELKNVLQLGEDALCVSAGAVEEEVIVGGRNGKLKVLKKCDGSVKKSLNGHDKEHDIVCVSVDKKSREVYSCTSKGSVIIWNEYRREQEFEVGQLREEEWITCMGILPQARHVFFGTSEGRLLTMNATGDIIRSFDAHVRSVRAMATGNNVLVSASFDGTIRISNPRNMSDEGIAVDGHTSLVNSIALNDDETLMASGSYDGTVCLWNVRNIQESVKLVREQHSSVTSVLFSADKQWLYSGDINGTICVWQVRNDGCDLSLARLLCHAVMSSIESIHINNDSELLVFSNYQVFVWNTAECRNVPQETNLFLPDVRIFGFSPDEKTISTWCTNSEDRCIKVRNMFDVYRHSDHFVSSFKIADSHDPFQLAVSNDHKMVAYADRATYKVIVGDTSSGAQLHTLDSVHQWAFSSTPKSPKNSSQQCAFESLYFSSEGGIIAAIAVTKQTESNSIKKSRKLFRWDLSSGLMIDDLLLGDRADHPDHSSLPLLFCKEFTDKSKRKVSNNIVYKQNDTVFNIATIEHNVACEHYCFNTSRLWVSRDTGGLSCIDLVTNNEISSCHKPALPTLSQPQPLPSQITGIVSVTGPEAEKVSSIFMAPSRPRASSLSSKHVSDASHAPQITPAPPILLPLRSSPLPIREAPFPHSTPRAYHTVDDLPRLDPYIPYPAIRTPLYTQAPISFDPNQPTPQVTADPPALPRALPVLSGPSMSSLPSHSSPIPSTPPLLLSNIPRKIIRLAPSMADLLNMSSTLPLPPSHPHTPQPAVFSVPRNSRQTVLDFSRNSRTPESKAKHALLSNDPNNNAIALVGMGGAGKTTILRALGRHPDVWQKFPDGVWFIELGHDAQVQRLFDQLKQIVTDAFPDFLPKFVELTANDNTHSNMMEKLVGLLVRKHFLLIFDDVWDLDPTVYKLVDTAYKAVQERGSCKVLTSTRNEAIGRVPTHDVSIGVSPGDVRRETCVEILCKYAGIDCTRLQLWSSPNCAALDNIVDLCAGLPLALSVAGSGMQEVIGRCTDASGPNAIVQYWESVKRSSVELRDAESGSRHVGLDAAIQTSLVSLERGWKGKSMGVGEMFRSFCVVEKQMCVPLCAIEKMWSVEDGLARVRMFSRHSLVSLDEDEGGLVRGIRLHDLVHDVCVEMAGGKEGVRGWHCRLVDGYRRSLRTSQGAAEDHALNEVGVSSESEEEEWWELKETEKYMSENVVRHLLGAGRVSATLKLLTDYRWVEKMNKDEERAPFRKVMSELELVRRHLEEEEKTEIGRRIIRDLDVVARVMGRCMAPYCMKNRKECTFQLFGRLRDVESESGLVERIVCSIEEYAERPWARCGPGVLRSWRSLLRRVLEVEGGGMCMCVSEGGEEVIVGGLKGEVWVLDGRDGRLKKTLTADENSAVVGVFFDCISGLIYSCNLRGQVTIWKEEKKLQSMHVQVEDKEDWINCMQVLPSSKKVVLGTTKGRLLWIDATSGRVVGTVAAHSRRVSSLAVGGSETVLVSGSWDGTIRAWDTKSLDDSGTVFEGHTGSVMSVALSADGRLLASASWSSDDGSVRLWDVPSGEPLWTSPAEYNDHVLRVLFSGDERLLYSMGRNGTNVWRVRNGGRDVSLAHTLPISSPSILDSLGPGDDPELFVLSDGRVQVWDVRQVDCSDDSVAAFLQGVWTFGVSENGTTMVTWNYLSKRMEIRNVCDVCDRIDRVISSFEIPPYYLPYSPSLLAVSNNQRFVAYSFDRSCVVHIVDARDGNVLHSLSDLDKWALSLTRDELDNASNSSNSTDSSSTARVGPIRNVGILSFSSDSTVISAFAAANPNQNDNAQTVVTKSVSWNVSSGEPMDETHLDADSTATSSTATPRLVCNPQFNGRFFRFPRNVKYEHGRSSLTLATMENDVIGAHYIAGTSRLLFSAWARGVCYVDLITDDTKLPPRNAPPLPLLKPHPLPPPPQHTITDTEPDQVYDVFISHAGTDKFTIALLLYNLLVALGFKVFLDRAELRPGDNAPEKTIKAMRTAKIAVVILSPEYAARKWTLKELMCFLERFRAGGEREITIIPVFYRLTLDDCRDENSLFGVKNDKGDSVFLVEGFLKWMSKQEELTNEKVLKGLQSLRGVTGIENEAKVTNGKSEEEKAGQMQFAEKIRDAVVEAKNRQNSKRAPGPSSAR